MGCSTTPRPQYPSSTWAMGPGSGIAPEARERRIPPAIELAGISGADGGQRLLLAPGLYRPQPGSAPGFCGEATSIGVAADGSVTVDPGPGDHVLLDGPASTRSVPLPGGRSAPGRSHGVAGAQVLPSPAETASPGAFNRPPRRLAPEPDDRCRRAQAWPRALKGRRVPLDHDPRPAGHGRDDGDLLQPRFALFCLLSPVLMLFNLVDNRFSRRRGLRAREETFTADLVKFEKELLRWKAAWRTPARAAAPIPARRRHRGQQRRHPPLGAETASRGLSRVSVSATAPYHPARTARSGAEPRARGARGHGPGTPTRPRPSRGPAPWWCSPGRCRPETRHHRSDPIAVSSRRPFHHGPADLRLAVLSHPDRVSEWRWVWWLPHVMARSGRRLLAATAADADVVVSELTGETSGAHHRGGGHGSRPGCVQLRRHPGRTAERCRRSPSPKIPDRLPSISSTVVSTDGLRLRMESPGRGEVVEGVTPLLRLRRRCSRGGPLGGGFPRPGTGRRRKLAPRNRWSTRVAWDGGA